MIHCTADVYFSRHHQALLCAEVAQLTSSHMYTHTHPRKPRTEVGLEGRL